MILDQLPVGPIDDHVLSGEHGHVWRLLEAVTDPEIPVVSLREMGVLRAIRAVGTRLDIVITPTYSGCPAMEQMRDDIMQALNQAKIAAQVVTQIDPAWSSDWLTGSAREKLREYGIAPPQGDDRSQRQLSDEAIVRFARRSRSTESDVAVPCPQCGSTQTTETSHFGSTACKALYRCLACFEPFDYFKPY